MPDGKGIRPVKTTFHFPRRFSSGTSRGREPGGGEAANQVNVDKSVTTHVMIVDVRQ